MLAERRDQRSDRARDLEAQRVRARRLHAWTPASGGERGAGPVERRPRPSARSRWRSSRERSLVDEPAGPQDPDAVAQRLDLAEDVRGEEHRLAALLAPRRSDSRKATSISGSRPLVGSSSSSSSARVASAAISWTFWRLPFDSARIFLRGVELEPLDERVAVGAHRCRRADAPRNSNVSAPVSDGHRNGSPAT